MNHPSSTKGSKNERKGSKRKLLELNLNPAERAATMTMEVVQCLNLLQKFKEEKQTRVVEGPHLKKLLHSLADLCKSGMHEAKEEAFFHLSLSFSRSKCGNSCE